MYKIVGRCQGEKEEIDEFETIKEAKEMLTEYRIAFGQGWMLWVEKEGKSDD